MIDLRLQIQYDGSPRHYSEELNRVNNWLLRAQTMALKGMAQLPGRHALRF